MTASLSLEQNPINVYKPMNKESVTSAEAKAVRDRDIAQLKNGNIPTDYLWDGEQGHFPVPLVIKEAGAKELLLVESALEKDRPLQAVDYVIKDQNKKANAAMGLAYVSMVPGSLMLGYGAISAIGKTQQMLEKPKDADQYLDTWALGGYVALALGGAYLLSKGKKLADDFRESMNDLADSFLMKDIQKAAWTVAVAKRKDVLQEKAMFDRMDKFVLTTGLNANMDAKYLQKEGKEIDPVAYRAKAFQDASASVLVGKRPYLRHAINEMAPKEPSKHLAFVEAFHADYHLMASPSREAKHFHLTI